MVSSIELRSLIRRSCGMILGGLSVMIRRRSKLSGGRLRRLRKADEASKGDRFEWTGCGDGLQRQIVG